MWTENEEWRWSQSEEDILELGSVPKAEKETAGTFELGSATISSGW